MELHYSSAVRSYLYLTNAGGYTFTDPKIAYRRREYQRARRLYEQDWAHWRKVGDKRLAATACGYLGDVSLATGDYAEARERHQQACAMYQEMNMHWGEATSGEHWGVIYSLDRLGDVALATGDVKEARTYYQKALSIARAYPQAALKLDILVSQAALLARTGQGERATELAALALHHPESDQEVLKRAQRVLDELKAGGLPADLVAEQECGGARDLDATIEELLHKLDAKGDTENTQLVTDIQRPVEVH